MPRLVRTRLHETQLIAQKSISYAIVIMKPFLSVFGIRIDITNYADTRFKYFGHHNLRHLLPQQSGISSRSYRNNGLLFNLLYYNNNNLVFSSKTGRNPEYLIQTR